MIQKLKEMLDIPCNFNTSSNKMPASKVKLDTPIDVNNIGSVVYVKITKN